MSEVCLETSSIKWADFGNATFDYIDLTAVDRMTHKIGETRSIGASSAPSRAQQVVRKDDLLFGTTRPTLARYCSVPAELDGQICSTGFCVLRADASQVLPRWIFHQLASTRFQKYVEDTQRGASYPAISDAAVMKYRIPVPPVDEQARITSILDRFDMQLNDLAAALQAELQARRLQYKHYRDRLLTLKEAACVTN